MSDDEIVERLSDPEFKVEIELDKLDWEAIIDHIRSKGFEIMEKIKYG